MSFEDEILKKKQKMQADLIAEQQRQEAAKRLADAFQAAKMTNQYPVLRMPSPNLQAVIQEAMPSMVFDKPKIVRTMPDGKTYARCTQQNERADTYSFDVQVAEERIDKSTYSYCIWFFNNGAVCFTRGGYNTDNIGVTADGVREKVIEAIADARIKNPSVAKTASSKISTLGQGSASTKNQQTQQKGGACYIATAVYGSYDCPEVWTLRRFRDKVLLSTWHGKLFVKAYYLFSPMLVRRFGRCSWFVNYWRRRLDQLTERLKSKGMSDQPYEDQ